MNPNLSAQFAHLSVPVERVQPGDLVRPMYSKARFEQAVGEAIKDDQHPFRLLDPDAADMYVVPYRRTLGPHTPQGVRHEVYRPR